MMIKRTSIFLAIGLLTSACVLPGQASATTAADMTTSPDIISAASIEAGTEKVPEHMTLYRTLPFSHQDVEWSLDMYATDTMVVDGQLSLDDNCRFFIRVNSVHGTYTLFDEQVQLGIPTADVWIDTEDELHITIKDARTAQYLITDYRYDAAARTFSTETEMDYGGINYWGGF